jgi:hypothetical protein
LYDRNKLIIMDNSNFPTTNEPLQTKQSSGNRNLITWILALGLVTLGGYSFYLNNKSHQTISRDESRIADMSSEKSEIQKSFDASLARLDSMNGINSALQSKLTEQNTVIARDKAQIRGILNKEKATAEELKTAKDLIAGLNSRITGLEADVAKLTEENKALSQDKIKLTADNEKLSTDLQSVNQVKQDLEKKVDVASTLNASNIAIKPIKVKANGSEKITLTAKHVDKLVISFDVDNRIAQSGKTDLYVLVTGPDGKPIDADPLTGGTFTTREEGDKTFTAKVPVDIETAKKKNVEFTFTPGTGFQQGNYTIQIYQNGFLIGQSSQVLKKGGLFS